MQLRMPLGALERALMAPVARHEAQHLHQTVAAQAAVLCARLAQTARLPDRKRLAWTCLREFLARNELAFTVGDPDTAGELMERVAAGRVTDAELAEWLEPRLTHISRPPEDALSLFADRPPDPRPLPRLYVACPRTTIANDNDASLLRSWCHIINEAVQDATQGSEDLSAPREWAVACAIPLQRSLPGSRDEQLLGREVFELNSRELWTKVDAMIAIGYRGGSVGVGQELQWAIQQGIPILYVVPPGSRVSRQVEGATHEADISIEPFQGPEHLARIVDRWLVSRRQAVEDGWRRREIHRARVVAAQAAAYAAWAQLPHAERFAACATAQLKPGRVHRLLTDPDALLAASLNEFLALTAAFGLEIGPLREPSKAQRKRLTPKQTDALLEAARENGWGGGVVIDLIEGAEQALALPGVRRMAFERMQDWVRFHDQVNSR